jgi:response regulator RpfG family c-di-GMP phosphodiesterase
LSLTSAFLESVQISPRKGMVGIVDDEKDITMLFGDALRDIEGISVFTFNDSLEALKHFTNNKEGYILIISDLSMPGMNGLDLVKKIKKLSPKTRIMITSGYEIEPCERQIYTNTGIINKIIEKPISISRFRQEVKNQVKAYWISINK